MRANNHSLPESPRLHFRTIKRTDLAWITELDHSSKVMRYITGGKTYSRNHTQQVTFPKVTRFNRHNSPYGFYALETKATGVAVGWLHLKPWWGNRSEKYGDIGYRLRQEYWGQGYASEAAATMIKHSLHEWHLSTLFAHCMALNHASQRVMEKCTMSFVGKFSYLPQLLPELSAPDRLALLYQTSRSNDLLLRRRDK